MTVPAPREEIALSFERLTDEAWWDDYWAGTPLPQRIGHGKSIYVDELLTVFDDNLPTGDGLSVLEIGGAPGRYLGYVGKSFGLTLRALEYSQVGYELTKRNLDLLGIEAQVAHGDMFDPSVELPRSDVVYSLGLIEHFDDPVSVIEAHLRFLKPGGLLVIGAPNLLGLAGLLHRALSPSILESHHAPSTDPDAWARFESRFELDVRFKAYIGGFEPNSFRRLERSGLAPRGLWLLLRGLALVLGSRRLRGLRRLNSRLWSSYLIAVYRAPTAS